MKKRPTINIILDRNQYLGQKPEDNCISSSHDKRPHINEKRPTITGEKRPNVNEKRPTITGIPAAAEFGTETRVHLKGDLL
jgi:hypothetical protein